jgi:hypothetical protein
MNTSKELTQERLQYLLSYNPETGEFSWLVNRQKCQAGEIAGCPQRKADGKVYIRIGIDGEQYSAHRLAWLHTYGEWPENVIDHIDQDSTNNRLRNLRDVTGSENSKNKKAYKNNSSGVAGIHFRNDRQKWRARIKVNGKLIHLGLFELKDDAITARKNAEVKYGFHPNHGR